MLFDKNQKQFKNDNQKRAWIMGKNIVPQKISLAKITDLPQREMFKQMYDFTVNIFSDMYENPELFNENVIQNPFGVIRLIAEFCKSGELKNNELIIPSIKPSESADGQLFSTRKECLARYGINLTENDNKSSLTSSLYPQLLPAYFLMYENAFRFKTGGWFYLAVCDFRIMEKGFAHNIDDIFRVLSDEDEIFCTGVTSIRPTVNYKPFKLY
ncbi:MAG: hypothetical protein LBI03_04405 [Clostridiales bacterium]|nr:hypothetical protein [Clostridiales bacterium]